MGTFDKDADKYIEFVKNTKGGRTLAEYAYYLRGLKGSESTSNKQMVIYRLPTIPTAHLSVPLNVTFDEELRNTFHVSSECDDGSRRRRQYYNYDSLQLVKDVIPSAPCQDLPTTIGTSARQAAPRGPPGRPGYMIGRGRKTRRSGRGKYRAKTLRASARPAKKYHSR